MLDLAKELHEGLVVPQQEVLVHVQDVKQAQVHRLTEMSGVGAGPITEAEGQPAELEGAHSRAKAILGWSSFLNGMASKAPALLTVENTSLRERRAKLSLMSPMRKVSLSVILLRER